MDVFDSNIWIFGLTRTCDGAVESVEGAVNTTAHVGVSAYIFEEVMQNLQRSEQPRSVVERAQTRFAQIVHDEHNIHGPTQAEIERLNLAEQRSDKHVQALAEVLGIQPKDVPVVVFAHQLARRKDSPRIQIRTADKKFGEFTPRHYFGNVYMQYSDCSN